MLGATSRAVPQIRDRSRCWGGGRGVGDCAKSHQKNLKVYMYIYIHTYIHIYIYTFIYIYIYESVSTSASVYRYLGVFLSISLSLSLFLSLFTQTQGLNSQPQAWHPRVPPGLGKPIGIRSTRNELI